ncbi:hypothetical protein I4F81_011098 [Pyropia yezoensis]|uniref:Uncharacterized protein n=1 Tax=Pyropia yezoensis TaxID=2788 RepID=A0ACC3CEV2_PYRYE|nr:hypothetical protein I4F81_011098 [Neopyropia yezoensis]
MAAALRRAVAPALAAAAVATLLATLLAAGAAPTSAQPAAKCATPTDVGTLVGWCRCSTMMVPKDAVSPPPVASADPWCKVTRPVSAVHYCDAAGAGACDLECAPPVVECTGPTAPNGVCPCVAGAVRTVLRYKGPLDAAAAL